MDGSAGGRRRIGRLAKIPLTSGDRVPNLRTPRPCRDTRAGSFMTLPRTLPTLVRRSAEIGITPRKMLYFRRSTAKAWAAVVGSPPSDSVALTPFDPPGEGCPGQIAFAANRVTAFYSGWPWTRATDGDQAVVGAASHGNESEGTLPGPGSSGLCWGRHGRKRSFPNALVPLEPEVRFEVWVGRIEGRFEYHAIVKFFGKSPLHHKSSIL